MANGLSGASDFKTFIMEATNWLKELHDTGCGFGRLVQQKQADFEKRQSDFREVACREFKEIKDNQKWLNRQMFLTLFSILVALAILLIKTFIPGAP